MSWFALIVGWIGPAFAAPEGCEVAVSPEAWATTLRRVEAAFSALDPLAFQAEMDVAARALRCLDAPVTPEVAARYHRLVGLSEFVRRDEERARLAFAAARAVDPLGGLPTAVLPAGHTARALSESASTPGEVVSLWVRRSRHVYIDGTPSLERPADRDALIQVEEGGQIVWNDHLMPDDPLPREVRSRAARRAAIGAVVAVGAAGGAAATLVVVSP